MRKLDGSVYSSQIESQKLKKMTQYHKKFEPKTDRQAASLI